MLVREKGKKDAEPVGMGWDEAQAAIQAGTHESAEGGEAPSAEKERATSDDGLDEKSKSELEALAKERGVDISAARTKAEIVEALRKA